MPDRDGSNLHSGDQGQPAAARRPPTPELVRQVAERVYALLLQEIRVERERARPGPVGPHGGFYP